MANSAQILDKIVRNMKQRGVSAVVRNASSVSVTKTGGDVLTVSYVDKAIQSPMGGVSAAASPFLGMGIAAPGSLKIKGAAAESSIAAIFDTAEAIELLAEMSGYANDIVIESGASTAQLARLKGHADLLGMGA